MQTACAAQLEPQPALPTSAPPAAPAGDSDKEPAADAQRSGASAANACDDVSLSALCVAKPCCGMRACMPQAKRTGHCCLLLV